MAEHTRQEAIERGFTQRMEQIALLQEAIDERTQSGAQVPLYIIEEYDDAVQSAVLYARVWGFDGDMMIEPSA